MNFSIDIFFVVVVIVFRIVLFCKMSSIKIVSCMSSCAGMHVSKRHKLLTQQSREK